MAICVAVLVAIVVSGTSGVARSAPALFFSDITSGPKTGGQDNLGAFITLYGEGFGASQGGSTVTIGGQPVPGSRPDHHRNSGAPAPAATPVIGTFISPPCLGM